VVYTGYGDGSLKPALFDELKTAGITIIYRDINPAVGIRLTPKGFSVSCLVLRISSRIFSAVASGVEKRKALRWWSTPATETVR
jgi:hypothetical protein